MAYNRWRFPHLEKGRFANYPGEKSKKTFFHALMAIARMVVQRKDHEAEKELDAWIEPWEGVSHPVTPSITWIGHSTFLIQIGGKTFLTDPIFDTLSYILRFKRLTAPGIPLKSLPPIDAVIISHNHPDHMDESSISLLREHSNPLFLVPLGDKAWFERRGYEKVQECTWWESVDLGSSARCTFLPAVHWSQRGLFDRNCSLWGSWMIEAYDYSNTMIYFAGDTAYGSHFKAIAERYPNIDIALMPIGAFEPRELTKCSHVSPEEAGQAFLDLNARCFIPMHWGTYHLGLELPLDPIKRIRKWWERYADHLKERQLSCMKIGQSLALPTTPFTYAQKSSIGLFKRFK